MYLYTYTSSFVKNIFLLTGCSGHIFILVYFYRILISIRI